jgi:hypothetical protein
MPLQRTALPSTADTMAYVINTGVEKFGKQFDQGDAILSCSKKKWRLRNAVRHCDDDVTATWDPRPPSVTCLF